MHGNNSSEYIQIGDNTYQTFQSSNDEQYYEIYGYKECNCFRRLIIIFLNVVFFGIPYIISCWYPSLKTVYYEQCLLKDAKYVLICDKYGVSSLLHVKYTNANTESNVGKHFIYRYTKYVWISEQNCFISLSDSIDKITTNSLFENKNGLYNSDAKKLLDLYGPNKIEIEVKSYWKLFIEEVFNPFYIFQIFSITLWCFDDYMIYAGCVLILSLFSIITTLIQTRKQSLALHNLIEASNCEKVEVLRNDYMTENYLHKISTCDLVPGDILVIPRSGCIMPCDAVILSGNCIVNESSLTGESVPITKTPPQATQEIYSTSTHRRHTLFAGTTVIQSRYYGGEYVSAYVVRTGFATTKGALVKSILYPTPVGLKFFKDSLKFIVFLFIIATFGMSYCLYLYIKRKADVEYIIIRALDIFTIVVPPALPAAMTLGTAYSQERLKKLGIFCISPPRIAVGGKVKLTCFDKTGTLTHEGLDLYCIVPSDNGSFGNLITDISTVDYHNLLIQGMTTCHSLTRINGKISGDPLDLSMFESTNWELEEPGENENTRYDMLIPTIVKPIQDKSYEIGIIRQFTFSSNQQCMSVICRELQAPNMIVFTKGAPERLHGMCRPDSLPSAFNAFLAKFTAQGFRCIAVAYKPMPNKFKWKDAQKINREQIESDLIFLGFIVMQNTLKSETTPIINTLHNANIRTVMITGDNIMTAICVARDCEMVRRNEKVLLIETQNDENIDKVPKISMENIGEDCDISSIDFTDSQYHFAMDGKTFDKLRQYYSDVLPMILIKTKVFARFQPDQKTQLIMNFQELDYIVSMVGDGANDCGALKAAHVGISLSQAEASVAAPFTSSVDNISCILQLILEGRCALVTSFAVFKYMALYSLIQFFTILLLYQKHSILGDMQFLFIDLIITTSLAVTIGRQGPSKHLVTKRPMGSLVSAINLIPLLLQIFFCGAIQIAALIYLMQQPWFKPVIAKTDETIICWENTVLFTVSCFQYVILACVYSKGKPHRQSLLSNFWLLFFALILSSFVVYLIIYPHEKVAKFFELLPLNHSHEQLLFRYSLLIFPLIHLLLAFIIEGLIAESVWLKKVLHFIMRKTSPKNKFKRLQHNTDFIDWLNSGQIEAQSTPYC